MSTTDSSASQVRGASSDGRRSIADLVDSLTLEEAVALLTGGSVFGTAPVTRAGIPAVGVTDGPAGARGTAWLTTTSLLMPCATALAATFDRALVRRVGQALGREVRAKGARVHLAPTVNLHRTPVGGRNFEAFSEDPELTAQMAVAYIRGVQSEDVVSCVKHFVGNDTEHERTSIDSVIDERTLREVYLRPFEAAIRDADVLALMTSYNKVNGSYVDESEPLMGLVRDEWGFEGIVMTDWWAMHSTETPMNLGVDLEMPGPGFKRGQLLLDAISSGDVSETAVRDSARRILETLDRVGALDDPEKPAERTRRDPSDVALARQAAAAATVLVKNGEANDAPLLPLDTSTLKRVAVVGPNAFRGQPTGGGSAIVNPHRVSNPLDALRARLADCEVVAAEGCRIDKRMPPLDVAICSGAELHIFSSPEGVDDRVGPDSTSHLTTFRVIWFGDAFGADVPRPFSARATTTVTPDRSGAWRFGITSIGGHARLLLDGEQLLDNGSVEASGIPGIGREEMTVEVALDAGRPLELEVRFATGSLAEPVSGVIVSAEPPVDPDPLAAAVALAESADVAVVVVGTTGDWESEGHDRADIVLPGDQDELVRAVAATSTPTVVVVNAGSPVAMPWLEEVDSVLVAWFPGQEFGEALADVLLGDAEPSGRLPVTFPRTLEDAPAAEHHPGKDGIASYGEGRRVGYRGVTRLEEPLFEFGFGLGYASISVVDAVAVPGEAAVDVVLRNESDRDGCEVIQLYVSPDHDLSPDSPARVLVGFEKVEVPARTTVTARVEVIPEALRTWDLETHRWAWPWDGPVMVLVGRSSGRIEQVVEVECEDPAACGAERTWPELPSEQRGDATVDGQH